MKKQTYHAVFKKDGKWFVGWIEEVPGAHSQGHTLREAKENLKDALQLILESNRMLSKIKEEKNIVARKEMVVVI